MSTTLTKSPALLRLPWNATSTLRTDTNAEYFYDYAGQDPINGYDLTGTWCPGCDWAQKHVLNPIAKKTTSVVANAVSPFTVVVHYLKERSDAQEATIVTHQPAQQSKASSATRVVVGSVVVLGGTALGVVHILAGSSEVANAEEAGPFAVFSAAVGIKEVGTGAALFGLSWSLDGYLIWSGLNPHHHGP